ncbi:hypothetical protein M8J76_000086 [Diaphorina citri]|nr:hypothetical protein M8J76_000086 [Diaphorina citri]
MTARIKRINLTGFYKAQYDNRRCWQKVTTAKYYFMFLEYKQGRLSAYEDEKRGAFTPWSQDNITVVWHALGHVARAEEDSVIKKVLNLEYDKARKKGRPRKRWIDGVRKDGTTKEVTPTEIKT